MWLSMLSSALLGLGCDKGAADTGGDIPEATDTSMYLDQDGDGFTPAEGDCDDFDAGAFPGNGEIACDGIDQNCDGEDLDDVDGDGYICEGNGGDDCDDFNPNVYPGAEDFCGDGVDLDCVEIDECDCDSDGVQGDQCGGTDCDDEDPTRFPGNDDPCYDGLDANCGGDDDDDCDGDGYPGSEVGGGDCDDANAAIHPGMEEECYDGLDNDCDAYTLDGDCDGDGYEATEVGGDDCDDSEPTAYPEGDESSADGIDSDCDEIIDEDAYCNLFYPTSNSSSATRDYLMVDAAGTTINELLTLTAWDDSTGESELTREWSGGKSQTIVESRRCAAGDGVFMDGWSMNLLGVPFYSISYDLERQDLPSEEELVEGSSWDYAYTATERSFGPVWTAAGTMTVIGTESISVTAGTFDALVITNEYVLEDLLAMGPGGGGMGSDLFAREGQVTMYLVERLGLVYSVDVDGLGFLYETRELQSYSGFFP